VYTTRTREERSAREFFGAGLTSSLSFSHSLSLFFLFAGPRQPSVARAIHTKRRAFLLFFSAYLCEIKRGSSRKREDIEGSARVLSRIPSMMSVVRQSPQEERLGKVPARRLPISCRVNDTRSGIRSLRVTYGAINDALLSHGRRETSRRWSERRR